MLAFSNNPLSLLKLPHLGITPGRVSGTCTMRRLATLALASALEVLALASFTFTSTDAAGDSFADGPDTAVAHEAATDVVSFFFACTAACRLLATGPVFFFSFQHVHLPSSTSRIR